MLKGKTALITGSTSGIGLGVTRALAAEGANVALNGFGDAKEIEKLRSAIASDFDVTSIYIPADISHPQQLVGMIRRVEDEFGQLDVLVNNAGIQHVAPVTEFPPERWEALIAVNLSSVFYATRAVLPGMLKRNWGRIINIASTHGLVASPEKSAYVAAKHGVVGFTKSVALETAKTCVTCNAICPGFVLTPLMQKQIEARIEKEKISVDQARLSFLSEKTPSLEFVTPEQLGALAVFLCSDAASQIRGATIAMDGGWTAQ
ncbi:3-hydroxybutyrate dehydrogenase [Bradyrhizobium sp. NP1]|uniref:3-hydroxybutyrate dehydrogenase n=1 Tax=Bradyrhizobium sp. NP1 TaxID=3049772 RepID=UPI0025A55317|nr:3-hydroxybutyrate dehydrogenase [Bradyrhizobium sp. NP1]WJR75879.1 3-hydroxybutyrate dehydrogenase [Bradyrhizobium sp. NP1]